MKYKYGKFSESGAEFIINNPQTPRAFDNFLWNDAIYSNVQQTGVGYCDYQLDEKEAIQLLTGNGRVCDFDVFGRDSLMSRLIYIRDNDTGEYWNVNWEPVRAEYTRYSCTHGLGYTIIDTCVKNLASTFSLLVPVGKDPIELWQLKLSNEDDKVRNLSIFVYNQFQFRYKWGFDSYGDMLYRSSYFSNELNAVVASKHPHIKPHNHLTGFITADMKAAAYDASRDAFVGTYGTLREPKAVVCGHCSNTQGSSDATIGALQFDITLNPKEEKELSLILGVSDDEAGIAKLRDKYLGKYDECLSELKAQKDEMKSAFIVNTPDKHFNNIMNYWVKQQAMLGAAFCRWGWNGYRDIVQHGYGVSSIDPKRTREILLEAVSYQYQDGLALRGWNPVDTKAYSDSALWLAFTLCAYIKETDDKALLSCEVPYFKSEKTDTVLGHIEQALDFLEQHKGVHDLCLIKFGDWNDSLTAVGKEGRGESVWLSEAYAEAVRQVADLYNHLGETDKKQNFEHRYEAIKSAINKNAWDGEWYVRCFDDSGKAIGSDKRDEGKIFCEAQGWALISGIADKQRSEKLIASCDRLLKTPQGYKLLAPTFTKPDNSIGRITYLEPGICENGTIYSHVNIWAILGLLRQQNSEKAYEMFKLITPGYTSGNDDKKENCPPYIYANCYYGPDHKNNAGQMEFTWMTGSIAWILNVMMSDFLGIHTDYDGIIISPCIPSDWDSYSIIRKYAGVTFDVEVQNPNHLSSGTVLLTLDGKAVDGNRISLDMVNRCGIHKVNAVICK